MGYVLNFGCVKVSFFGSKVRVLVKADNGVVERWHLEKEISSVRIGEVFEDDFVTNVGDIGV